MTQETTLRATRQSPLFEEVEKESSLQTKMCDTANRRPDWCQSQRIPGVLCLGLWAPNGTLGTRFIRVKVRYKGAAVPWYKRIKDLEESLHRELASLRESL